MYVLEQSRASYHDALRRSALSVTKDGVPSIADSSSKSSIRVAQSLVDKLGSRRLAKRLPGQLSGNEFEDVTCAYLNSVWPYLSHLRPGDWDIVRVKGRGGHASALAQYEQYAHLIDIRNAIDRLMKEDPKIAASLSADYTVSPDIVIIRRPESDETINRINLVVGPGAATRSSLRQSTGSRPFLHASISCKWTLRSDRGQNARTEALNLIRNRKGRLPHVVVVTGEPLPTRVSSIAIGTGDVDCVYHFALNELSESLEDLKMEDQLEVLTAMVEGKRLKDISDLPLDLAV